VSTLPQPPIRDERAAQALDPSERPINVLIVGVGGQGVLMISKVLAQLCARRGLEVKQSEVHGMAKRGGVVFSHVRFGSRVWSPTIPVGEADVVVALEWAEGLRWLSYLRPERGTLLADTRRIVPPLACRDRRLGARTAYPTRGVEAVRRMVAQSIAVDALGAAEELGNPRAANTVLLGALSTVLDFPIEEWHAAIDASVPPRTIAVNRAAFERGRKSAQSCRGGEGAPPQRESEAGWIPEAVEVSAAGPSAQLEIDAAWCKGCEICVTLCPERCLALDERRVARVTDPWACTGCRVCEWLCPDFAIRVRTASSSSRGGS
jgi:indolepyruvate ferredoxin oxidoreductase beta subunit